MQNTSRFRRSGSVARFFVDGLPPDPRAPAFCQAMRDHRFRTIETAASEEVSVGWVTAVDPTGDTFAVEDLDHDVAFWLRMRIDKKVLPGKWAAIYKAAAERAVGRPLSAREKRELKVDLMQKLLPRVLPSVNLVDALYFPSRKLVTLFATSRAVKEGFAKLFFQSFGVRLLPADPYVTALHVKLDRAQEAYLDEVSAVNWPTRARTRANGGHASRDGAPADAPLGGDRRTSGETADLAAEVRE
jgi:recombination associated protein RdgC